MSNLTAVDLFAGAGGATQGLSDAGFDVVGAVENDSVAAATYRLNHPTVALWEQDIRSLPASRMMQRLGLAKGELHLLKACPPCQGFSTLAGNTSTGQDDPRNELVEHTVRFVRAFRPAIVLVENVPGLARNFRSNALYNDLRNLGYNVQTYVVNAASFGVPQNRKRFIMLAARGRRTQLPDSLVGQDVVRRTVEDAFADLGKNLIQNDPLHEVATPKAEVQRRIAAVPIGGNRFDLPADLVLKCHARLGARRNATGAYGRMKLDEPSPTMTTRCTTPSSGSFIHPKYDRAITLREAATLQTFPYDYAFVGSRGQVERQIGNAVPVLMAKQLASIAKALICGTAS